MGIEFFKPKIFVCNSTWWEIWRPLPGGNQLEKSLGWNSVKIKVDFRCWKKNCVLNDSLLKVIHFRYLILKVSNDSSWIVKKVFSAHPIDPSALECCSKMMDSSEINKMIQDIDFNDLYDDNYFSLSSKQDSNKGKVLKK